jgi:hypothetical protein
MQTVKINGKLTTEERETLLRYDPIDKMWFMDSSVPKHFRKALKQCWTPTKQYIDEDGIVSEMTLIAPERAITIRSTEKKQLSEKQLANLGADKDAIL